MNVKLADDTKSRLIFACSGASDVGHLTDRAARALAREGVGRMYCLAGIGGRVESMLATARAAKKVLVIDGCDQECGRKTLQQAGLERFLHLKLAELGFLKSKSTETPGDVNVITQEAADLLSD